MFEARECPTATARAKAVDGLPKHRMFLESSLDAQSMGTCYIL